MLGTVAPVGRPEWCVVVQKPESQAYAAVTKMVRATEEWGGIALGLAIVAAIPFASGISPPIRLMAQRTRDIAKRNYQQRVAVKAINEIGALADDLDCRHRP